MSVITTHILDTAAGRPAANVAVTLTDSNGKIVGRGTTDADGRVRELVAGELPSGRYRITFAIGEYFATASFYPEVSVDFVIETGQHYHVPLLISPFGYSTYRGS
jgi:5-hydroxyisourate hydrolase